MSVKAGRLLVVAVMLLAFVGYGYAVPAQASP